MRLDDIRESDQIEDRRGQGGYSGGGGGGFGIPGGGGGLGIGAIIVISLIGWAFGINPAILIQGAETINDVRNGGQTQSAPQSQPRRAPQGQQQASRGTDDDARFVSKILAETEDVWARELPKQLNIQYEKVPLVLFTGATRSGCGTAQSAMGPFYCPEDKKVYLDMAFFREMKQRLGGGGEFAYAYVIAHEVGHHVQDLMGVLGRAQEQQGRLPRREANGISVRIELMADCFAGVWANHASQDIHLEQSDIREAVDTAAAIGDDRLQSQSQGRVVPDSFTHGSSEQRQQWLATGLKTGSVNACNTFGARNL